MHMDHKFSEIDHVTLLFNLFLVVHLPTHSDIRKLLGKFQKERLYGLYADVTLVENEYCNLIASSRLQISVTHRMVPLECAKSDGSSI